MSGYQDFRGSFDLLTLVVWWELMAVASAVVVFVPMTARSYGAGMRYLGVHLFGGVLLMAGAALYIQQTGSADFGALSEPEVMT